MMAHRTEGITLVEVLVAVVLGALLVLGTAQLFRFGFRVLSDVGGDAVLASSYSRFRRTLLADMGEATFVYVPSTTSSNAEQCTSWSGAALDPGFVNVRPLLTLVNTVTATTGTTSTTYTGYEVRKDSSGTSASVWRVSCSSIGASPTYTARYPILPNAQLPSALSWNTTVRCLAQGTSDVSSAPACLTDRRLTVLTTTMNAKVTAVPTVTAPTTVTLDSALGIIEGMSVEGTGIPANTYVTSANLTTSQIVLSATPSGMAVSSILTLGKVFRTTAVQSAVGDTLALANGSGVSAGMVASGAGIAAGSVVTAFDGTIATLSASTTAIVNNPVTFTAVQALVTVVPAATIDPTPAVSQTVVATRSSA